MLRTALTLLVIALFALSACGGLDEGESVETGHLTLGFAFGARDCQEVDVGRILVELRPTEGDGGQWHDVTCEQTLYGMTFPDLEAGRYRVSMQGIGPGGDIRYEATDAPVFVVAAEHTTDRIVARGESLSLSWTDAGGACGSPGEVVVRLLDPDGNGWDAPVSPCASAKHVYEGLYPGEWTLLMTVREYVDGQLTPGTTTAQGLEVVAGGANAYALSF